MPDINDPEVQAATMKIQLAYQKRQQKLQTKQSSEQKPEADNKMVEKTVEEKSKPVVQVPPLEEAKKQGEENVDEMPNIEDPEVQAATMKIQMAYHKRQQKLQAKQEKEMNFPLKVDEAKTISKQEPHIQIEPELKKSSKEPEKEEEKDEMLLESSQWLPELQDQLYQASHHLLSFLIPLFL